jgi:uncharacterized membrane protein YcgQ (UPF0703/DUF1980 family)
MEPMNLFYKLRHIPGPLFLGLWGCLLLRLCLSGQLSQVQNPAYHGLTFYFSLLLLVMCLGYPFLFDPPSGISIPSWPRLGGGTILFSLPLVAYALLPEDILSTQFLRQRANFNLASPDALQRFLPGKPGELHRLLLEQVQSTTKEEVVPLDLLELVYLSQDQELRQRYANQQVVIPGQWLAEDEDHFKLGRLLIFCCAADGRTVLVRVNGKTTLKGDLDDGSWIEITGTIQFKDKKSAPELDLISYEIMEGSNDFGM